MARYALFIAALIACLSVTDADAQRRRRAQAPPPIEEITPAPRCFEQELQLWVNCQTNQPIDQPQTDARGVVVDSLSTEEADLQASAPVPANLPLDITSNTIEQFNDSRVADLHNRVGTLIADAVRNARRPFTRGRNQNLVDEIQVRLDPLVDYMSNGTGPIDYYWMIYYEDRTIVFVKPVNNLHILRYTILTNR